MTRTQTLYDLPGGKGRVRGPRPTDAVALTLRNAFETERALPDDIDLLLVKLSGIK